MEPTTLIPKTRTEYVANQLRDRILRGDIKGGSPIRQDAIAAEFGVSRIPVREALLLLKAEGLVDFVPYKGAYATELSTHKITELFHLRCLIECDVLVQAIPLMTEASLAKAETLLAKYDQALATEQDVNLWSEYNFAYHMALYECADLPESLNLIESLNTLCSRYIRMQLLYTQKIKKAVKEHHQLLHLCRDKNIEAARALLEQHIVEAGESIIQLLKK
ncbi:MAG: GntR family transcriptional regulator [Neisseriaceae bacterium]|nr:GntR family transcriptional regulator [Neisseriaceae bacterium]MBP6863241.1 GntR family transcriptional regulator [Neisseriaceae bacterium]